MNILRSSLVVSFLSLLNSLISFVNQIVIATYFGASARLDAYLIATSFPLMVSGAVCAVISYTMVPALIAHGLRRDEDNDFAGLFFVCMVALSSFILLTGYAVAPTLIGYFGSNLPREVQTEAVFIARVSWSSTACAVLTGYLGAIHNATKRFYTPIIVGILPYLGMVLGGILGAKTLGPVAIAWGLLVGSGICTAILLKGVFRNLRVTWSHYSQWRAVTDYFKTTPLIIVAMGSFTVYTSIDTYWAPQIGPSNLSYLGYCQRILVALGSLVIVGPSVVLVPRLAECHLEGRQDDFLDDLTRALRLVLIISIPIAVTASTLAVPIVEVMFQRGAFGAVDTLNVVSVLPFMMTGMVAMLCVVIIFRSLYVRRQFFATALIGATIITLYFTLSGLFSHILMLRGIALAYTVSWWIGLSLASTVVWKSKIDWHVITATSKFYAQITGALIPMYLTIKVVSYQVILPIITTGLISLVTRLIITIAAGIVIYAVLGTYLFQIHDMTYLLGRLIAKRKSIKHEADCTII